MHTDIIIRPSGVWNTRSPLFQFVEYHRRENQMYWSMILTTQYASAKWSELSGEASFRTIFDKKGRVEAEALRAFRESFPSELDEEKHEPTVNQALQAIHHSTSAITEYAIVSYFDIFESYLQCWTLNYLLTKLENKIKWTLEERRLADDFSPFTGQYIPTVDPILKALPDVRRNLANCPHIFEIKTTGKKIETPITRNLTALNAIHFWREARNLLVHKDSLVSSKFYNKYQPFWNDFEQVYPHAPNFMIGRRFVLNHHVFRPITTTLYRAAKSLREMLVKLSAGRRGHVLAPNSPTPNGKVPKEIRPDRPPKMLISGDHDISYRWTYDEKFRNSYRI